RGGSPGTEVLSGEVQKIGSLEKLNAKEFPISDDTVMHLTTAEVLVKVVEGERAFFPNYTPSLSSVLTALPGAYGELRGTLKDSFCRKGGGCGAAVRAMCIGLVESGRLTHHHPTGLMEVSFKGVCGASGHNVPMIAYDALLQAGDSWVDLANHGFFHGGNSDSTSAIAAAWWGVLFGFRGVPESKYHRLEYRDRLARLGVKRDCLILD
uniref:ADP-ribosylhydrolase ARH1 n=1 Tax=Oncorhynchus tshawytscha TaxID=74940 RepID=A0A8C8FJG4_ONCTS